MNKDENKIPGDDLTEEDLALTGKSTISSDDDSTGDDDDGEEGVARSSEHQTFVTREGLKKLQDELDDLEQNKRKEIAKKLKEAISYGDLSENSEYEDAKNEQALLEGRIASLRNMIKHAKIITESKKGKSNIVKIGSTVTIQNLTDGDAPETFTIVGSTEADPAKAKISNESPIGSAILDKEAGSEVIVHAPAGDLKYKIVKIK